MSVRTNQTFATVSCAGSAPDITAAATTAWPAGGFAGGVISVPGGSTITSLTFYHCDTEGGTYQPLHDSSGTAVTMTVAAGNSYVQPNDINSTSDIQRL